MSSFKGETHHPAFPRLPLLGLGLLALLTAVYGGLIRMQWHGPSFTASWASFHGPLLVSGFLGVMIGLERAVKLGQNWIYLIPLSCGLGTLWILADPSSDMIGKGFFTLASILWMIVTILMTIRRSVLHNVILFMGSACWLSGNFLWVSQSSIPSILLWWAGFLVLNFVGMRLEILHTRHPGWKINALFGLASAFGVCGTLWALNEPVGGTRIASVGLIMISVWFLTFDSAQRKDVPKNRAFFEATCLKTAYGWLMAGGWIGLLWGPYESGRIYDAFLHALFLGYIFCLSCAHVFQLNDNVIRKPMRYLKSFWIHYMILNLSLLLRVLCDLTGCAGVVRWAGLLNALAVLVFLLNWYLGLLPGADGNSRSRAT